MQLAKWLILIVLVGSLLLETNELVTGQFGQTSFLATNPSPLEFYLGNLARDTVVTRTFQIYNGSDLFGAAPLHWQASADEKWVSLNPASGTINQAGTTNAVTVILKIDSSALKNGIYRSEITISSDSTIEPTTVNGSVRFTIGSPSVDVRDIKLLQTSFGDRMRLQIVGSGIKEIQLQIYDLKGRSLVNETADQDYMDFRLLDRRGRSLANGIYLYTVIVKGFDNTSYRSSLKKVIMRR